jgi:hypothetical protein
METPKVYPPGGGSEPLTETPPEEPPELPPFEKLYPEEEGSGDYVEDDGDEDDQAVADVRSNN